MPKVRAGLGRKTVAALYDRIADRYDRQHSLLTAHTDALGRRLLAAEIREGDLVLDAGGGTGSTALLAADATGPRGRVVVADISQGMLGVARARLLKERPDAPFVTVVSDLVEAPLREGAFDVVLSTYSVCPLSDPDAGALSLYRLTKPGGLLGIAHSAEPRNALLRSLGGLIESVAWHIHSLSMGCRAVSVLPSLLEAGAELRWKRSFGFPLWPFLVFIVRKPDTQPRSDLDP